MTSFLLYPEKALVHVVPDHVSPKHACFVEPFACSLHAVDLGLSFSFELYPEIMLNRQYWME